MIACSSISRALGLMGLLAGLLGQTHAHASSPTGSVIAFDEAGSADLVLIEAGLREGFRQGMSCIVSREGRYVADLVLVESRQFTSSALIVGMTPGQRVSRGDVVVIKTLKGSN